MLRGTAYFDKFAGMGSTEDPMQIDRLIQIIFLLLSHESITAKALAEEFGVSTRTIYRDINILSVAGIPKDMAEACPYWRAFHWTSPISPGQSKAIS